MALTNTHFGYEKIREIMGDGSKNVFFSGIGGISMNSLARVCHARGHRVSGFDRVKSEITSELESIGITVYYESSAEIVKDADVFVYTVAIPENDAAYVKAGELGIPRISRADFLGYLMMGFSSRIGISGMHGKSTTTAITASIYNAAGLLPTVFGGAIMKESGKADLLGDEKFFIFEACEYMDSFLDFYPTSAVVLNIEMDHVDYFKSMEHIKASFSAFMAKAKYAIVNIENEDVMSAAKASGAELISFGSSGSGADFTAENVSVKHGIASFDIVYRGKYFCKAKPSAPGMHMVCDCLAAAAAAFVDGIDGESIERGIHEYRGIGRRMDNRGKTRSGADVYDDYAHHPTEIANTLEAACQLEYENVYCVFQPHTFSRTAELLEGFADVLGNSKTREIILAEIYPAREINTYGISSEKLACEIRKRGKECRVFGSFDEIAEYMNGKLTDKDTLFVVGAGDINKLSKMMVK